MQVSLHRHQLSLSNRDNGWACDGRHTTAGCLQKCTGFDQTKGWKRYRCAACDYDLCVTCTRAYSVEKSNEIQQVQVTTHQHTLRRDYRDNGWSCDGKNEALGCLRGCTGFSQSKGWKRYRCSACDYDLCGKCALIQYSSQNSSQNIVKTSAHRHSLQLSQRDNGWACDGRKLRGGCRKGCTGFNQTRGWVRYRCKSCDFDLCEQCTKKYSLSQPRVPEADNIPNASPSLAPKPKQRGVKETKKPAAKSSGDGELDNCCCICMDEEKNAVLVHGETSHLCCCYSCAKNLKAQNSPCPICRAPIESVFLCYSS